LRVLLDACVLYPAPIRDLLVRLGQKRLIWPHWTEEIHEEWMRSLLKNRPDLTQHSLLRTCKMMNKAIPDALIDSYQDYISDLFLPDPNDRHVLAAAIKVKAEAIITLNLSDFPMSILSSYKIKAIHPDLWLSRVLKRSSTKFREALIEQQQALKNPPCSIEEVLIALEVIIPNTVKVIRSKAISTE
jgi:predicted nucleic acid-binding protein